MCWRKKKPDANRSTAVVNKFKKEDEEAKAHTVLNLTEKPVTIVTTLLLTEKKLRKYKKSYVMFTERKIFNQKLNWRSKLFNSYFTDGYDWQGNLINVQEIFLSFARLNSFMTEHKKTDVLLRLLPNSFGFIALMDDTNKMDYESMCTLLKSVIKRRKRRENREMPAPVPAARFAENVSEHGIKKQKIYGMLKFW